MFNYKIDIIKALKDKGYSTYKIRQEKIFAESTLQQFRDGQMISWNTLDVLCTMLQCNIGDIVEHVTNEDSKE